MITLEAGVTMRATLRAAEAGDGAAVLTVSDTGVGIAAEHLSKLGDRFYRVDLARADSRGGAGLGLAIVKSIVALHGGRLLIDSAPGRGTDASLVFGVEEPRQALARGLRVASNVPLP